ncbi:hypothetical protein Syun_030005 [Stephania yunnanensis]|uniref:Uncharacterized protein n=1 Tax=Stephania yunnanensis TaxID=152371 RepID=A0AAP0E6P8_9MAGN
MNCEGTNSSLKKLRNKLRSLEQIHKECSANLRAREVEWDLQMEELTGDLNQCRLELNYKDQQIEKLQMELEANTDLPEKTLEVEEIELGFAERLKSCLNENQEMRREMEMSLLSQVEAEQNLKNEMEGLLHIVEEKDKIADDLKQQIVVLDEELMRTETEAV